MKVGYKHAITQPQHWNAHCLKIQPEIFGNVHSKVCSSLRVVIHELGMNCTCSQASSHKHSKCNTISIIFVPRKCRVEVRKSIPYGTVYATLLGRLATTHGENFLSIKHFLKAENMGVWPMVAKELDEVMKLPSTGTPYI